MNPVTTAVAKHDLLTPTGVTSQLLIKFVWGDHVGFVALNPEQAYELAAQLMFTAAQIDPARL